MSVYFYQISFLGGQHSCADEQFSFCFLPSYPRVLLGTALSDPTAPEGGKKRKEKQQKSKRPISTPHSLCLGSKSSFHAWPCEETVVPSPKVGVLVFRNHRLGFVAKNEADHVVPGNEGDIGVGAIFFGHMTPRVSLNTYFLLFDSSLLKSPPFFFFFFFF